MEGLKLSILLLAAVLLNFSDAEKRPVVRTGPGYIEGVWQSSAKGVKYAAFMGIPFANPPVGDLRFKPPVAKYAWDGVWDAGDFGPMCIGYEHVMGNSSRDPISGQEDCLYLNVYTPLIPEGEVENVEELLDVIFYIPGGAFMYGGSDFYGAKYLLDRNMILVTINYRVGPLGFLSFEDEFLPGNNGLRDQALALKWVSRNIALFGGNPRSVTLMGQGAGGASVHLFYFSNYGLRLHKNGISMSGTALCPWALVDNAREKGLQFATSLGCEVEKGTENILECLRQRPAAKLVKAVEQFIVWQNLPFSPFGPVIEYARSPDYEPFLFAAPLGLMLLGRMRRLPWMVGVVENEGLYPVANFIENEAELERLDRDFDELVPHLLDFNFTVNATDRLDVTRRIRREYFGDKKVSKDTTKELIKMVSDRLYVGDIQNSAFTYCKNIPIHFYKLNRRPSRSFSEILTGTTNDYGTSPVDDHYYLMNMTFYEDYERTGDEKIFMEMMLDFWSTFAGFLNMTPESDGVDWGWVEFNRDFGYLDLNGENPAQLAFDNDLGNFEFWSSLPINEDAQRMTPKNIQLFLESGDHSSYEKLEL